MRPDIKDVLLMLEGRMEVPSPVRNHNSIDYNANFRFKNYL